MIRRMVKAVIKSPVSLARLRRRTLTHGTPRAWLRDSGYWCELGVAGLLRNQNVKF